MKMDFDGKVAVVTGASRGLGGEVARGLAEAGATVYGFDVAPVDIPGVTDFRVASSDKIIDAVAMARTVGRMASPSEVAPAVPFLASDLATFCSGSMFDGDGGWTAVTLTGQIDYSAFA